MAIQALIDPQAYSDVEHQGWETVACRYEKMSPIPTIEFRFALLSAQEKNHTSSSPTWKNRYRRKPETGDCDATQ